MYFSSSRIPSWVLRLLPAISIVVLAAILAYLLHLLIPYNMDEFLALRLVGIWRFPANAWDVSQNLTDLNVFNLGLKFPALTYGYIGSLKSFLYYPLYLLWPSPVSARFLGILFLGFQAYLIHKLFRLSVVPVFAGLCLFFPYFFTHAVDAGPLVFGTTSIFLLLFLIRKWLQTGKQWWAFLASVTVFLGLLEKMTFLWLLPGIVALVLVEAWDSGAFSSRISVRKFFRSSLPPFAVAIFLVSFFFLSPYYKSPGTYPFIDQIKSAQFRSIPGLFKYGFGLNVVRAFFNPLRATVKVYAVENYPLVNVIYDSLLFLWVPFFIGWLTVRKTVRLKKIIRPLVYYAAFLLTAFIAVRTYPSEYFHHAVLSYPFLLISILYTAEMVHGEFKDGRLEFIVFPAVLFLMLNLFFFAVFPAQPVFNDVIIRDAPIFRLIDDPRLAPHAIYAPMDWGMFYYQFIYGVKGQSVMMVGLDGITDYEPWLNYSHQLGREMAFIYNGQWHASGSFLAVAAKHGYQRCEKISRDEIWQLLVKQGGKFSLACSARSG
jgi:hypothetical protein